MNVKKISLGLMISAVVLTSCKPKQFQILNMRGVIVEMNDTFDNAPNKQLEELVLNYKSILDKEMNQVVGQSSELMDYGVPESMLTNFTSDVMKQYADNRLANGADIAVMNVHGHRATLPKGDVTLGNLYEIYSFDNTITYLELKGDNVIKMFDSYAYMGGAGISSNVKLVIKDRKVESVTIDGKEIDKDKMYNIVTLDYLADGNNGMEAFLNAESVNNSGVTLRDIMIEYVNEQTQQGKVLTSELDGRITIIQ